MRLFFTHPERSRENTDLETRIERLEGVVRHQQEIMDDIAKYVESDIATPWMTTAKNLVWRIKSIPKI